MKTHLRLKFFQIQGADFICIPHKFTTNKKCYKLCWVRKTTENFHNLLIEYEVICYAQNIIEAKERAKWFVENFTT